MTHFHAVLTDECGNEFGAGVDAATRAEAFDLLRENYPESRVVQLESPQDTADREARMWAAIHAEAYGDDWEEEEEEEEEEDSRSYTVANENGWTP